LFILPCDWYQLDLADPNDVFTIAYSDSQREGIQFTHENVTAGVTAIRALFPISNPLSSVDTIISAFSLSTPFGRAIAYTALYEAAHFTTLKSTTVFGGSGGESSFVLGSMGLMDR
jgi:long-chain acyl-CoA synthetase